jgi:hypothetical protein
MIALSINNKLDRRLHCDFAKELCDKINQEKICRHRRIFRQNSWQQKIYNKLGNEFLEKAKEMLKELIKK